MIEPRWRLKRLAEPTDPNAGPSASYPRGVLREERLQFLAQHTELRIQALHCRRYKPSAALEAKRFPKLPVVATKLLPKEARRQPAAERRAELNVLVANYIARGGEITVCPPETTSAQLKKQKPKAKMGRPPIGERPMTARPSGSDAAALSGNDLRLLPPTAWRNVWHRGSFLTEPLVPDF